MFFLRRYHQFLFLGCAILLLCISGNAQSAEVESTFSFALEIRKSFYLRPVIIPLLPVVTTSSPVVVPPTIVQSTLVAHLIIPKIYVDAMIEDMGYTADGAMAIPNNGIDVSWFSPGTLPGDIGSAVIGGHNVWNGPAVFKNLDQLIVGDTLTVVDANGIATSFIVREIRMYNPADDATDIFYSQIGVHLNLITCSGDWDPSTKSYTKRLVIFTDLYTESDPSLN